MLVEFAGVPGSGKSHSADRLREWLTLNQIPYADVDEFVRLRAARPEESVPKLGPENKLDLGSKEADVFLKGFRYFMLQEPKYTLEYLNTLFQLESDKAIIDLVSSSFFYCCARRGFFLARQESRPNDVVIHEEGLVHRLFTLFGYRSGGTQDDALLARLAELTPRPDIVFWTRCSPALAVQRLNTRVRKMPDRLTGLSADEAAQVLAAAETKIKTASLVLQARGTRVAQLQTDADPDDDLNQFRDIFSAGC